MSLVGTRLNSNEGTGIMERIQGVMSRVLGATVQEDTWPRREPLLSDDGIQLSLPFDNGRAPELSYKLILNYMGEEIGKAGERGVFAVDRDDVVKQVRAIILDGKFNFDPTAEITPEVAPPVTSSAHIVSIMKSHAFGTTANRTSPLSNIAFSIATSVADLLEVKKLGKVTESEHLHRVVEFSSYDGGGDFKAALLYLHDVVEDSKKLARYRDMPLHERLDRFVGQWEIGVWESLIAPIIEEQLSGSTGEIRSYVQNFASEVLSELGSMLRVSLAALTKPDKTSSDHTDWLERNIIKLQQVREDGFQLSKSALPYDRLENLCNDLARAEGILNELTRIEDQTSRVGASDSRYARSIEKLAEKVLEDDFLSTARIRLYLCRQAVEIAQDVSPPIARRRSVVLLEAGCDLMARYIEHIEGSLGVSLDKIPGRDELFDSTPDKLANLLVA